MFGMALASDHLEKLAANRIKDIITTLAKRPIWGVFLGIILTIILQSSGAVTSMLVGLGSARVISLQQVMSVILGTAIGSTFTVQVISFNVSQYGLPLFAMSFMIYFLSRKRMLTNTMAVGMGFGLIFFGLELISVGTEELRHVEVFTSMIDGMKASPLYAIALTAFFTGIVHSSAVTIGFAMSLASAHIISLEDSVYWIFGANIGTTATALVASIGGNYVGRQVAWAHCLYKIASIAIFVPIAGQLADWLQTAYVERDIANIHTLINFLAAVIFYPGVKYGALLVEKIFPPGDLEKEYSVRYLNKNDWESPAVVLAHAEREVLRMADIVQSMIDDSLQLFREYNPELEQSVRRRDDRCDLLNREISLYLASHLEDAPSATQLGMMRVLSFATDLESAADVIDNQLLDLANKKHSHKVEFSSEGWEELRKMHKEVGEAVALSISCFQKSDRGLAKELVRRKREIRSLEQNFRESHITRLSKGRPETISTSSIHMDLLGEYRRIVGLMSNHAYALTRDEENSSGLKEG